MGSFNGQGPFIILFYCVDHACFFSFLPLFLFPSRLFLSSWSRQRIGASSMLGLWHFAVGGRLFPLIVQQDVGFLVSQRKGLGLVRKKRGWDSHSGRARSAVFENERRNGPDHHNLNRCCCCALSAFFFFLFKYGRSLSFQIPLFFFSFLLSLLSCPFILNI